MAKLRRYGNNMFIPAGMTEAQVLADIEKVIHEFADSYTFGYYELEDIQQEARMEAIKALPKYDPMDKDGKPTRPLANFLFAHVKNRILNLRRNKYKRTDPPCNLCHNNRQAEHTDGKICRKYIVWKKRNSTKANLTRPLTLDGISEEGEPSIAVDDKVPNSANINELRELINEKLDPAIRLDYLRILAKEKIPKTRREQVEAAIREIINENYLDS